MGDHSVGSGHCPPLPIAGTEAELSPFCPIPSPYYPTVMVVALETWPGDIGPTGEGVPAP